MNTTKKLMTLLMMALAIALQASAGYEELTYNGINYEFYFSGTGNNAVGDSVKVGNNSGFSGVANIASSVTCEYTYVSGLDAQGSPIYTTRKLTAPVIAISKNAFQNCRDLTSVTIPNSVIEIGEYAFAHCLYLTNLSIGNSVDSIGQYAFQECASLPSVAIPNSVTSIPKGCFSQCRSMTSVSFPSTVTDIGTRAFYDCRKLTGVNIPNSVTTIGDSTFYGCIGLANVMIGNSATSIPRSCFNGCTSLTSVNVPNSVTAIGDKAFYNCQSLTSVDIPNTVTTLGKSAFYNCTSLTSATIGNAVDAIKESTFYNCRNLRSFSIPNSVTAIGYEAFYRCTNLTSLTIGNSVASIGEYAFYYCEGLTSVAIPNSVITIAKGAFYECMNLTEVALGNAVTTIGDMAFLDCRSLKGIDIPNSVTTIGNDAFFNCSSMASVIIGNSVATIGNSVFTGCTSLTSVDIPNSVTEMGTSVFYNCSNLRSVNISNSLIAIPSSCFYDCIRLESVIVPNQVETIWDWAFAGCRNLSSVTFPSSIIAIENNAFYDCISLTSVTCQAMTPPHFIQEASFDERCYENATLHVPASAVESYCNAPVWKKFVHIQAIDNQPGDEPGYEYVPFVREGVKWVYYIDDYNYHVDFYTNPARGNNTVYRTLELKGDTLINDKIYKALHLYSGESIDEENDTIPVFLREEDKKVYGIIPDGVRYDHCQIYNFWDERLNGFDHWYNGEEFLLYDFQNPAAQWENLLNSFDYDEDFYTYTRLFTDTIPLGNKLAKRYVGEINSHEYQTIEGVGLIGYNSTPFLLFQPLFAGIHDEIYGLEKVVENGEVIYPQNYVEDGYLPLISEGVKWVNERVTVNHGDTTCYYYTYEFKGNHPVTGIWGLQRKALYRYEGLNHQLDTEQDSIVSGLRENGAKVSYFNNVPLDDVISQGRDMIDFQGTSEAYDFDDDYDYGHRLLYGMSTTESGWLNSKYYYTEFQRESFLNDDNFVKADPIMIDGYKCSRLAYIGEQGDTLAYIVEGIGFDSRDMGDLLTPFTRRPNPSADYQEWCGLSHVIKDGKIIYKGMRYNPNAIIVIPGDVNGDGEVTLADANSVIDIVIMGGNSSHPRMPIDVDGNYIGDVNSDGEITIADINSIIDMILNKN